MYDPVITFRKYIGRSYESYNCFELVKEFYKDQFGLDLSNYWEGGDVPSRDQVESLIVSNKGDFVRVDTPEFGDIVVIKLYGLECHVGVVVSKTHFLHSARNIGSLMDRLERYSKMNGGYFRHRERSCLNCG